MLIREMKKLYIKNSLIYVFFSAVIVKLLTLKSFLNSADYIYSGLMNFSAQKFLSESTYLWQKILSSDGINVYLLIITLVTAILLIVPEYRYSMNELLMTQKNGKRLLPQLKLLIGLVTCSLSSVFILFAEPVAVCIKYGVSDLNVQLQILPAYEETTKNLTILQALFMKCGFQIFGYCCLLVITLTLLVVLRSRSVMALTCSVSMLLLPAYFGDTLYNGEMLYKFPLPLSPILSYQYLSPSIVEYDKDVELFMFKELTYIEIGITNFLLLLICIICVVLYIWSFRGRRMFKNESY